MELPNFKLHKHISYLKYKDERKLQIFLTKCSHFLQSVKKVFTFSKINGTAISKIEIKLKLMCKTASHYVSFLFNITLN